MTATYKIDTSGDSFWRYGAFKLKRCLGIGYWSEFHHTDHLANAKAVIEQDAQLPIYFDASGASLPGKE